MVYADHILGPRQKDILTKFALALGFTPGNVPFIVDKALEYKLGARGLRSLCEAILTDAMYELPSSDDKILEIDVDYAKETLNKNLLKRLEIAS